MVADNVPLFADVDHVKGMQPVLIINVHTAGSVL